MCRVWQSGLPVAAVAIKVAPVAVKIAAVEAKVAAVALSGEEAAIPAVAGEGTLGLSSSSGEEERYCE